MNKRVTSQFLLLAIVGIILTTGLIAIFTGISASNQSAQTLTEAELIQYALDGAVHAGLKLSGDPENDRELVDFTLESTLDTWNQTIDVELAPEAGNFDLFPENKVLIVVIRGEVQGDNALGLPQPGQIRGAIYDNLYVTVDALTGKVISTASFKPGQLLPFYSPAEYAGGSPAIIDLTPESTAEPQPLVPLP